MAAATNCGQHLIARSKLYCRYYVGNVHATGNETWTFVDHPVMDFASGLKGGIHRLNHLSAKGTFQLFDGLCDHEVLSIILISTAVSLNLP
jgi:hypothetical protein